MLAPVTALPTAGPAMQAVDMRSQAAAFHTRWVAAQLASTAVAWAAAASTAAVAVGSTAAVVVDTGKI